MDSNALRLCSFPAICFLLAACSAVPGTPANESASSTSLTPGRKLLMMPDQVWADENCELRPLPYLRLERSELTVAQISPGNSIVYRFLYTACVPPQPGYLLGRFRTTVSLGEKELSTRSDDTFPVETGKWIVDTDVAVPKNAETGVYSLEGTLAVKGVAIRDRLNFTVQP